MDEVNRNVPDWKQKLSVELRRDKKKTAILTVLLIVAVVVGVRTVSGSLSPSSAEASTSVAGVPEGQPSVSAPVSPVVSRAAAPADAVLDETWTKGARKNAQRTRKFTRDVFAIKLDYFPPAMEEAATQPASAPACDSSRDDEIKEVRALAKSLSLQSTVISARPTAVINGSVLRVGEWISGFELVEITARTCVVAQKGVKVQLFMPD